MLPANASARGRAGVAVLAVCLLLCITGIAGAQPFFGGGTAFDPEVDVIQSGALLDAQVVVSHDRRYVTITMGASNSRLQDLALFPVQVRGSGSFGFVGGVNPGGASTGTPGATTPGGRSPGANPGRGGGGRGAGAGAKGGAFNTSPTDILNQNALLNREGTFLLARLQ